MLLGLANNDAIVGVDRDDVNTLSNKSVGFGIRRKIPEMILTTISAAEEKMTLE